MFYSRIVLTCLHPVVDIPSCILLLVVGRIFFRYFGIAYFDCIDYSLNPSPGLYPRNRVREVLIIYILCIHIFATSFGCYFSNPIDFNLLRSAFIFSFHIGWDYQASCLCLSVPFSIIPRSLTITGTVKILKCHIFFSSYFLVFIFAYFIL